MAQLCKDCKTAWQAIGHVNYERADSEKNNVKFRRSLYVVKDIKKGEIFTSENVRSIRPGFGIAPKFYEKIIGKKSCQNILAGTALKAEMVSGIKFDE